MFHQYEQYLGKNLTGENLEHFQIGMQYQKQAVDELNESDDINEYVYLMDKTCDEYKNINQ